MRDNDGNMNGPLLLMLGDSLVDFGNWQELLPRYTVVSRGVPGERSEELLCRLPHCCSHNAVDAVLVMTGTNNLLAGTPDIAPTVQTIVSRLRLCYPATAILINSLAPILVPQFEEAINRVNSDLRAVAEASGVRYLDLYRRFEKFEEELFDIDGVHFNSYGYTVWADLLAETLGTLLAKDGD